MGTILGLKAPKLVLIVLSLLVLGIIAGGGIALATSNNQPPAAAATAAVVPAQLSANFAVLSEGGSGNAAVADIGSPGVSSATVAELSESSAGLDEQFGLNASLAREVTYEQTHVWVIPGSNGICIRDFETGEGTCGPIPDAIEGTVQLDVGGGEHGVAGGGTIYGLVANGNAMVVVHDADGSTEDVPVQHNVYIIGHRGAVTVEVLDGTGQTHTVTLPK